MVFYVFDSEGEPLSGEARAICLQRIFKDTQPGVPTRSLMNGVEWRATAVLVGTRVHNAAGYSL